ncbi:unnamed protein product, partial [Rotaria sp. Silwood2]
MSITDDNPYFLVSNKCKLLLALNVAGCGVYVRNNIQDIVLNVTDNHNHLPYPENIPLKRLSTKVKQRVMKETTPITKIYEVVGASEMRPQTLAIIPLARDL